MDHPPPKNMNVILHVDGSRDTRLTPYQFHVLNPVYFTPNQQFVFNHEQPRTIWLWHKAVRLFITIRELPLSFCNMYPHGLTVNGYGRYEVTEIMFCKRLSQNDRGLTVSPCLFEALYIHHPTSRKRTTIRLSDQILTLGCSWGVRYLPSGVRYKYGGLL